MWVFGFAFWLLGGLLGLSVDLYCEVFVGMLWVFGRFGVSVFVLTTGVRTGFVLFCWFC